VVIHLSNYRTTLAGATDGHKGSGPVVNHK
jgi:hypothetical protein